MARTYKDTLKRIQHNYYKYKSIYASLKTQDKVKVDNWHKQEPSWWTRLTSTKKRRAEERFLRSQIDLTHTDFVWPLDKKPHIYFW